MCVSDLDSANREGFGFAPAVVDEDGGVRNRRRSSHRSLRSWKTIFELGDVHGMTTLGHACTHSSDRELGAAQPHEHQDHEVTLLLHLHDQIGFGFDRAIGPLQSV